MGEKKEVVDQKEIAKKLNKPSSDKIVIFSVVIITVLVALAIFGVYFYKANMEAVVSFDGGKVTKAEYTVYYKTFAAMLTFYGYDENEIPVEIAKKAGLDKIIVAEAQKAGITLTEDNIKSIDEVFNDAEQIKSFTEQGIDVTMMRKLYESDYVIQSYIQKLKDELTDEEVIEYIKSKADADATVNLNGYETRHILIKTQDSSGTGLSDEEKAEKKATAEAILQRALAGEDFASLAKEFTEDTGTKEDGGKYTVYDDGNTVEQYTNAVKDMKVGEVKNTLVETSYGYHIIKLENIVENGRTKSSNDRENIVNERLDKLTAEKQLKVDNNALFKLVESITGKKLNAPSDSNNSDDANKAE